MRIGMVTACYKPVVNGVTRMIALYKEHLEALGHEVTIFTLGDPDPAGDEPGVMRSPGISLGDTGYYVSMGYTREARERLQEIEILHCHHLFMSVELAHRYGRCPIIYTNHTRYDLYTETYIPLPQPAADAIMRQVWPEVTGLADVVITPSASVRQVMIDFGVTQPIEVIPNGIDLPLFLNCPNPMTRKELQIPETAVILIYVGRLADEKNLPILLSQFAIAKEIVPEVHLMLLGKGPAEESLRQQAQELGLANSVTFCGAIEYSQIPRYLSAADMFVTASVTEVHPLTIIEGMACGLPVAATVSPGIVDTVESGKTGFLVANPSTGLAAAMVGLAVDPALRRRMGMAAREASKQYTIGNTIAKTVALYERLIATRPDLARDEDEAHGRWQRRIEMFTPLRDQLAALLKAPESLNAPLRRLFPEEAIAKNKDV